MTMAKQYSPRARRSPSANAKSEKVREHFRAIAKDKGHDFVGQLDAKTILPVAKKFHLAVSSVYKYRTQVAQEGYGNGIVIHKAPAVMDSYAIIDDVRAVKKLGIERCRAALKLIDLVSK